MTIVRKTTQTESGLDSFDFCCSSLREDRYGDIVVPSGIDTTNFNRNNVALFNHSANAPIGTWENVRVVGDELRGRLKLAPAGSSPRIDEIRALLQAKVLKATSIGFIPIESEPITKDGRRTGGMKYLRSELIEISLVSTPANPDAVALAKSLKISSATMREVFKNTEQLSFGQRIRNARRAAKKARAIAAKATTERSRAVYTRSAQMFEKLARELLETAQSSKRKTDPAAYAREVHAKALATLKRIDARIAREEAASFVGQKRREQAETLANFTAQSRKHSDPPKSKEGWRGTDTSPTWRGQKLPSSWRGKKV